MTSILVHQRIRNRIIEMFEWIIESEHSIPELGFNELVNSWEDWVPSPFVEYNYPSPIYTIEECGAIQKTSNSIDAFCDATTATIEESSKTLTLYEWASVVKAAREGNAVFQKRGRLPENEEVCK